VSPEPAVLRIDGSQGEGGGQLLRTSLSLSALTGRPFRIDRIRANRTRPGLRPQHLTAVEAVASLCDAAMVGNRLDSTTLEFRPRARPRAGAYHFDVTEASKSGRSGGAVTLIFQAILWPLLFADPAGGTTRITLRGGTQVPFSPPFHYLAEVVRPAFARLGARFELILKQWGWASVGGGVLTATIEPIGELAATVFEPETADVVHGIAAVTNLASHIPHRMERRAHNLLREAGLRSAIVPTRERGDGPGAGMVLWLPQAGFSGIGRPGLPAEHIADAVVAELLAFRQSGAAVDAHLADQLLVPMALAHGVSSFTTDRLTQHTLTHVELLRQWLGVDIGLSASLDQPGRITVQGIGFVPGTAVTGVE
jgi:RNA 3'-terminal phosphate cyclase (ATP)